MSEFKEQLVALLKMIAANQQETILLLQAFVKSDFVAFCETAATSQQEMVSLLKGRLDPDMNDESNWLNTQQTLEILPVSKRTLYTLRETDQVISRKNGRYYEYFKPSLYKIRNKYLK